MKKIPATTLLLLSLVIVGCGSANTGPVEVPTEAVPVPTDADEHIIKRPPPPIRE